MDFKQALIDDVKLINNSFEKYFRNTDCPEGTLNESTKYSLLAGGKRLRPILILETYKLFKQNVEACIPFAVAMEMIHTFSLIHDDLPAIDNDDYRRGKLTNHKKFNEATAILAGDSLLNNAYMIMIDDIINSKDKNENDRKIKALYEISYGIDRMIAGEYIDTEYEGKQISSDYLEYMHKNKTGALIKASVKVGAIIAGAEDKDIEKLSLYAEKIGLAFQIKDDILSEIGDALVLGKPVGNDKAKGKCTYVSKYGLEEAKKMLESITKEATEIVSSYETDDEFLKELALYIANRNK
ncbi:MAG: polyprenyl synthetase family protein [Clostridia bacterium]|nr:polyprenyl synthetase family protein [Clostridia bacterium]